MKTLKSTWIARCPACESHRRLEAGTEQPFWNRKPAPRCDCGRTMATKLLKGRASDHDCGARCQASKGHVCECACAGANHGVAA